jgi:hypothetical protein
VIDLFTGEGGQIDALVGQHARAQRARRDRRPGRHQGFAMAAGVAKQLVAAQEEHVQRLDETGLDAHSEAPLRVSRARNSATLRKLASHLRRSLGCCRGQRGETLGQLGGYRVFRRRSVGLAVHLIRQKAGEHGCVAFRFRQVVQPLGGVVTARRDTPSSRRKHRKSFSSFSGSPHSAVSSNAPPERLMTVIEKRSRPAFLARLRRRPALGARRRAGPGGGR